MRDAPTAEDTPATDQFSLAGMTVIVTGAGRGIGRGIAVAAADAGASVVGCSRTDEDLESLEADVRRRGGRCTTLRVDVSTLDGLKELYRHTASVHGRVDAVVNNVGTNLLRAAVDYTEAEVDDLFSLNLKSVYWSCVLAARTMATTGTGGSILNVTSQASVVAAPGRAPYAAAKAAVNHLTRTLAAEWAPSRIRVNALAPTVTATPLGLRAIEERPEFEEEVKSRMRLGGRLASVREISGPAIFLLSPAAALITGQTLVVDGGWTL